MEKFLSLPVEKQTRIIDAALKAFGTNGYKKTSVSDIAAAAEISKAMVFHYFGSKKALYLYLIELCGSILTDEVEASFDYSVTDFFERIKRSAAIEISVMKKHSAIPAFLTSMYFEADPEIKADIKAMIAKGEGFRNRIAFAGTDCSKFKDSVDPELVMKMLLWLTDGYMNQIANYSAIDYDSVFREFEVCIDLLKNNFYKEG